MSRRFLILMLALCLVRPAHAEVPNVVTDIAPVQSLVAQVMAGVGVPALIVPPRASPHGYAMRPSEARALAGADVVIWVGPALTRWLEEPINTLAPDAIKLLLMETPGNHLLPFREGAAFGGHPHDDADGHGGHEDIDPHLWLDPRNAALWLGWIADVLAEIDPDNADAYRANATASQTTLAALEDQITAQMSPLRDRPFIVYHDAFYYFEARFSIEARAAVSDSEATTPGAARIAELRDVVRKTGPVCAFGEPQFNADLLDTVTEGQDVRAATLDPMGTAQDPGPALYADVLRQMADVMADCLAR